MLDLQQLTTLQASTVCNGDSFSCIIIIIIIIIWTANGFTPGGSGTKIKYNTKIHKITHYAQTKYSKQSYTNNNFYINSTINFIW
jgi:hypothetical protein